MANKPHPLQAAAQVAQSREQAAAKALSESQQRLTEQQNRLQQLLMFRTEYANQFQNEGSTGISARRYQDYSAFLTNMDHGIVQLQQQLAWMEQELQRKRLAWLQNRAKTMALDEVIERDRKAQLWEEGRREQRDSDEHNLRDLAGQMHFINGV
ncbi:MAG TPA: flagellar export protein FliJ [Candidatus Competibacteraceae bacterium]|nr:flagellar export protein FliJ [Candidatus Competibacteraceae bacterium]MCP5133992.1 flagellar export protein FliJ [Gammaproteobacteria bacterium]HPF60157.1 flagellar export protein FliJ [Candidatus Competibacteraceae bacterium]HRY19079.1 flagellar export protein FliJ [Candidatus Competibacteraceae bacterium]